MKISTIFLELYAIVESFFDDSDNFIECFSFKYCINPRFAFESCCTSSPDWIFLPFYLL